MDNSKFYIPSLDGIRALAFLIVFFAHSGAKAFIPGGFGVTVFFFLSGYLITTLLMKEFQERKTISIKDFFIKRFFRIFPPLLFAISVGVLLTFLGILNRKIALLDVFFQIFQISNYTVLMGFDKIPLGTGIFWSLAVEEHFYFVFPFIFYWSCSRFTKQQLSWGLLTACVLILLWRILLVATLDDYEDRIYKGTDTRIDSILFGCLMATAFDPFSKEFKIFKLEYVKYLMVLGLMLVVSSFFMKQIYLRETIRYTIQGIGLIPIFFCAIKYPNWLVFRVLNLKLIKHIGMISYSLYLVHFMVLYSLKHFGVKSNIILVLAGLVISLIIAQLMRLAIELPMVRCRNYFIRKPVINK